MVGSDTGATNLRRFIILLAIGFPIVLTLPTFWWLVNMNFGAQTVVYRYADGTTQAATLGPLAAWPEWALVPAEAALDVRARFEHAPGRPASGSGGLMLKRDPAIDIPAYLNSLREAGWKVDAHARKITLPTMPPRLVRECIVKAVRMLPSPRQIELAVDLSPPTRDARIHWREEIRTPVADHFPDGDC